MPGTTSAAEPAAAPTVLAVAESDAYLKWVAWLLDGLEWPVQLTVLASDIAPSDRQRVNAISGTRFDGAVLDDTLLSLRRRIRRDPPDVLVLACTGPTIAVVTSIPTSRRPLVVAGLPGVGLPVRDRAIRARNAVDVFIAHSRRERDEYAAAFQLQQRAADGTVVAMATLPFLGDTPAPGGRVRPGGGPVVFAAQPSVPSGRDDRRQLLTRLAALGPPAPVVKLRTREAEQATHHEPHGYEDVWRELVAEGAASRHSLEFTAGALTDSLADASCLVTVSSTAALEAVAVGCPVVIIDDFGVDDELLNAVFARSGLIAPLRRSSIVAASTPEAGWLDRNYFHGRSNDDWQAAISARVAIAKRGRRRVGVRRLLSRTVVAKAVRLLRARSRPG